MLKYSDQKTLINSSPFFRQANAAWEAGIIDKFFSLDMYTKALVVATYESRKTLEILSMESDDNE